MATYNYLDKTGLGQVWNKIKDYMGSNFLSKTNTTPYTPTNDYNPATKKYVDDNACGSYTLAINGNVIQLKEDNTVISSITLPIYNGGVSS